MCTHKDVEEHIQICIRNPGYRWPILLLVEHIIDTEVQM
jgi:hypothetical protein